MSTKQLKEVLDVAKGRGWSVLRTGGHNQTILVHTATGARMTIWSTAVDKPTKSIINKMTSLERSKRIQRQREATEWICGRFGIKTDEAKVVKCNLRELAREYLGPKATTHQQMAAVDDWTTSDRVWMMEKGRKGAGQATDRLICGGMYLLTEEQRELVESVHQVNGVIEISKPKRNGVVPVEGETEPAGSLPLVPLAEPVVLTPSAEKEIRKATNAEMAAVGIPAELAAALRAHLGVDAGEVKAGLSEVVTAHQRALEAHEVMAQALNDLAEAIELVLAVE